MPMCKEGVCLVCRQESQSGRSGGNKQDARRCEVREVMGGGKGQAGSWA